jgi:hypothetical protein
MRAYRGLTKHRSLLSARLQVLVHEKPWYRLSRHSVSHARESTAECMQPQGRQDATAAASTTTYHSLPRIATAHLALPLSSDPAATLPRSSRAYSWLASTRTRAGQL